MNLAATSNGEYRATVPAGMYGTFTGLLLGLLVGVRHAFEPDHLAAVSTLVAEAEDGRRGAMLGAIWGLGHTLSLVVVGIVLFALGTVVPARVAAGLEIAVAVMLVWLGLRSIVRAVRIGPIGPAAAHRHQGTAHAHAGTLDHLHVGRRVVALRPLLVGIVHGLAGSGALTALVFAELPDTTTRMGYITLFGLGSVAGMAIASGLAGATLHRVASGPRARRALGLATGTLSIAVGIAWAVPMIIASA